MTPSKAKQDEKASDAKPVDEQTKAEAVSRLEPEVKPDVEQPEPPIQTDEADGPQLSAPKSGNHGGYDRSTPLNRAQGADPILAHVQDNQDVPDDKVVVCPVCQYRIDPEHADIL